MSRIELTSTVGSDGVLRLQVPLSPTVAGREVKVTVEPVPRPPMTMEEWHTFIDRTAGSIADPTFHRWEQGEFEQREMLP